MPDLGQFAVHPPRTYTNDLIPPFAGYTMEGLFVTGFGADWPFYPPF